MNNQDKQNESPRISASSQIGEGTIIDPTVIVGHPGKTAIVAHRSFTKGEGATIGNNCILRSGTVIYERALIGDNVQTAHHAIIREGVQVCDGCVVGNNSVILQNAHLGRNVRIMDSVVISEGAWVGNDVFIGPHVSFTASRYMLGSFLAAGRITWDELVENEGDYVEGVSVTVEDDVRIGSNAVILAGVRLGKGCVIAAGAVVSTDIPPNALVAGNPARIIKKTLE